MLLRVRAEARGVARLVSVCDERFALPAALALISAACSSREALACTLAVLETGEDVRSHVARAFDRAGVEVEICELPAELVAGLPARGGVMPATYGRLYAPGLVGERAERTLYLDADTVTLGSIDALVATDLDGATAAGVVDPFIRVAGHPWGVPDCATTGVDPAGAYINAGVLLIDNAAWLDESIEERALAVLRERSHDARYEDQVALNIVLAGRWKLVDAHWNRRAQNRLAVSLPGYDLSGDGVLRREPAEILHFIGGAKPWDPLYPPSAHRAAYRQAWARHLPDVGRPADIGKLRWLARRLKDGPPAPS